MTPSAFAVLAPGDASIGVAVRCPSCSAVSVNLVTQHVDFPFWNDARVGVVEHVFEADALRTIEEFRAELDSAQFDERASSSSAEEAHGSLRQGSTAEVSDPTIES